jgi:hypothetical protein
VNKDFENSEQRITQASIGRALGLSRSLIHRYVGMGMPTTSIDAARAWHRECIKPTAHSLIKPENARRSEVPATHASVVHACALMAHAADALATGQAITVMVPALRAALHAVPLRERAAMLLHSAVMDVLISQVAALLPPRGALNDDASPAWHSADHPMTVHDADELGRFWFKVAAGEIVVGE